VPSRRADSGRPRRVSEDAPPPRPRSAPSRRRGSYVWEGRDDDGERIDRRSRELIERTGIRFGDPGGLAEESLESERALRHEPPRVRKAAAREMAKFFKPKPQMAERRSQKTVVFDAVLRDARRQRRKAGYSSSKRR